MNKMLSAGRLTEPSWEWFILAVIFHIVEQSCSLAVMSAVSVSVDTAGITWEMNNLLKNQLKKLNVLLKAGMVVECRD